MTREDLNKLVTVADLEEYHLKMKSYIETLMNQDKQEFYTPKEFHKRTGMPYRTVLHYCNTGKLNATQKVLGGGWLIHNSEINILIDSANKNKYD